MDTNLGISSQTHKIYYLDRFYSLHFFIVDHLISSQQIAYIEKNILTFMWMPINVVGKMC